MIRKVLSVIAATLAAGLIAGGVTYSANLSILSGTSGCTEGSQMLACLNTVIRNINSGVNGMLTTSITSASTTAVTTEEILHTYSLPANTIGTNGQGLRIRCWGSTGANANNKTMKLYFGATSVATPTAATNAKGWELQMDVWRTAAATQQTLGTGIVDTTAVTPAVSAAGTDSFASAVTIKCTGTNGTASAADITANGMTVEQLK